MSNKQLLIEALDFYKKQREVETEVSITLGYRDTKLEAINKRLHEIKISKFLDNTVKNIDLEAVTAYRENLVSVNTYIKNNDINNKIKDLYIVELKIQLELANNYIEYLQRIIALKEGE